MVGLGIVRVASTFVRSSPTFPRASRSLHVECKGGLPYYQVGRGLADAESGRRGSSNEPDLLDHAHDGRLAAPLTAVMLVSASAVCTGLDRLCCVRLMSASFHEDLAEERMRPARSKTTIPTDSRAARSLSSKRLARAAGSNLSTTALIESQLTAGPEPVLGVYLHVAYMTFMSTYEEAVGRGEITPNMIGVLSLLAQRSGMSQAELARLFGMERATMGAIVARAMEAGFVTRKESSGDARRYSLDLTSRGEQMLVKLRQRIPEHEKQAAGRLTLSEREQLRALLDKLVYG